MNSLFVRSVLCSPWLSCVYFQTSLYRQPTMIPLLSSTDKGDVVMTDSIRITPENLQVSLSSTSTKIIVGELLKPFFLLQRVTLIIPTVKLTTTKNPRDMQTDIQTDTKNSNFFFSLTVTCPEDEDLKKSQPDNQNRQTSLIHFTTTLVLVNNNNPQSFHRLWSHILFSPLPTLKLSPSLLFFFLLLPPSSQFLLSFLFFFGG